MTLFIAVVEQEGDSAYGVHFPDVPGCFSAADEEADVLANAQEALALYFEDEAPVKPRDLPTIRRDPEVAAFLARGSYLLAVPLVQLTGRTVRANITLDKGLLDAIDQAASERGLSRSAYLADLAKRDVMAA
jgi:predicted RNase H-like HicB family nuclease